MARSAHNIVLYRVDAGGRMPVLSLAPTDVMAAAKIAAQVGTEMRSAQMRGVDCPTFRLISEKRSADESGLVVTSAEFIELDSLMKPVSRDVYHDLNELFAPKAETPAPESEQQKAAKKSAALSV